MPDVEIIREKPLALQVCSRLSPEETTPIVNQLSLCGTEAGWVYQDDRDDAVVTCSSDAERHHYVYVA